MLIFGHTGLTLGAAVLLNSILSKRYLPLAPQNRLRQHPDHSEGALPARAGSSHRASWFVPLTNRIDASLLLVGSLLPDIIDKPFGQVFFKGTFSSGRIFSHTLLFLVVITLLGLYLYRNQGKRWLLALAFGTFAHLMEDEMWRQPRTLLWPLYGFSFERLDLTGWAPSLLDALLHEPAAYIPELIGASILVWFIIMVVRKRKAQPPSGRSNNQPLTKQTQGA